MITDADFTGETLEKAYDSDSATLFIDRHYAMFYYCNRNIVHILAKIKSSLQPYQ